MKVTIKILNCLVIVSLVLFSFKPILAYVAEKQRLHSVQYTTNSECSSRTTTTLVTYCQTSGSYIMAEDTLAKTPYLFLIIGALFFIVTSMVSSSPISRLFKPPIFLK